MKYLRQNDGQAVIEFVAMFPFLLFMGLFIVEFAFGAYQWVTVRNAASEAARYAAVGALPSAACAAGSIQDRVVSASNNLVSCDEVLVTYQDPDTSGDFSRRSGVAVRINYAHTTITPLPAVVSTISWGVIPSEWTLTACADSRLEIKPATQGALVAGADCS